MNQTNGLSKKTWCLDCFERREPWVIRWMVDNGVFFHHDVLDDGEVCSSCREILSPGTDAMCVRYPGCGGPTVDGGVTTETLAE